jgi:hypothetical protein
VLVEPRHLQVGRFLEALAINAVVRDALDDVVSRRHTARDEPLVNRFDAGVAAEFLVLRDDENDGRGDALRRFDRAEADALGRVHAHVRVALHLAGHLARVDGHRLYFAARLLRVQAEGGSLRPVAIGAAEAGHLRGHAFHARVERGHHRHQTAAVAAAHDADALRVHRRLARDKADGRANVLGLVGVIHLPAQRLHLHGQLALLVRLGLRLDGHELALALAPAAIIERKRDVALLRKNGPEPSAGVALGAARARAKDDGRRLLAVLAILRQVKVARHARAIAPDGHRAFLDALRQCAARGRLVRICRTGRSGSRRDFAGRRRLRGSCLGKVSGQFRRGRDAVFVGVDLIEQLRHLLARDLAITIAVDFLERIRQGVLRGSGNRKRQCEGEGEL